MQLPPVPCHDTAELYIGGDVEARARTMRRRCRRGMQFSSARGPTGFWCWCTTSVGRFCSSSSVVCDTHLASSVQNPCVARTRHKLNYDQPYGGRLCEGQSRGQAGPALGLHHWTA